ncbi:HlyD family secretion protein [Moraxella bovoculi]|uniref:HlyD family secretion protein n=1 Tax=Moraxella bovoculi TaxID=386891 RepID=UPI003F4FC164
MPNLFRQEALDAQKAKWTGTIILTRPVSFTFLTCCALLIGLVLVAFLIWGDYTKRSTVKGQLIPEQGLVYSHSPTSGVIIENYAYDGKVVKKGELLYKISTAHYGENGNTQKAIGEQLAIKNELIKSQIYATKQSNENELRAILTGIDRLKSDQEKLIAQIKLQETQVQLAFDNLNRYKEVQLIDGVSATDVNHRQMEYNAQNEQLNTLNRELNNLIQQIKEQEITLNRTKQLHKSTIRQLQQSLSDNVQSNIQNKANEIIAIYSPIDGVISNTHIKIGQYIDSSKPLLTLLPNNHHIIAEMYVPSRAIGFVKTGDEVLLRYQAYPYQKFGHANAQIISVAKTALAGQNIQSIGIVSQNEQMTNEPLYIVRAKLEKQTIKAYGNDLPLQVGMTLEGDILHETRKLYEWVLEPLYSITGKI